jgi:hypothetical protein
MILIFCELRMRAIRRRQMQSRLFLQEGVEQDIKLAGM